MKESDQKKIWLYADLALVFLLIIGVWCLLSVPTILYHLPKSEITANTSGSTNATVRDALCSAPLQYTTTSDICLKEFAKILSSSKCSLDPENYPSQVINNNEIKVTQLINGLTTLGASAECLHKSIPLLCQHLLGLCSGSGLSIQPTASQCEEIRDTTCKRQWMIVEALDIGLPNCEELPADSLYCPALNDNRSTNGTVTTYMLDAEPNNTEAVVLECSADFYQENGSSYCTRSCYNWIQHSNGGFWRYGDIFIIMFISLSILACTAILIISCLARKRILIFPAVFLVYMMIDGLIIYILVLLGYMDRGKFFCTSRSLLKSLTEVTPFCIMSGIMITYLFMQATLWWIFHVAALYWKVIFPFHAQYFERSGRNKYLHITCIIVGILLPLVPIIIIMVDTAVNIQKHNANFTLQYRSSLFLSEGFGFGYTRFPTGFCTSRNSDAYFYSTLLIKNIITGCGCTMLIIIFRSIHKLYLNRKVQETVGRTGPQFTFGTAEKKLCFVLCYYILLDVISNTSAMLEIRSASDYIEHLQKFLFCEQRSQNSSNQCIYSEYDGMGLEFLNFVAALLVNFYPFVNLVYAVNIQELKLLWKNACSRLGK